MSTPRVAYLFGDDDLSLDRAVRTFGATVSAGGEPLKLGRARIPHVD